MGDTDWTPEQYPDRLMVIVVKAETGEIREVFGVKTQGAYDTWYQQLPADQQLDKKPANPAHGHHPYSKDDPHNRPQHVAIITNTHYSPGCTWTTVGGWPVCI